MCFAWRQASRLPESRASRPAESASANGQHVRHFNVNPGGKMPPYMAARMAAATRAELTMHKIQIEGPHVKATSPEGKEASMPLEDLFNSLVPQRMDRCGVMLPEGIRAIINGGSHTIWVHETPPRPCYLKWIAPDSPARYGPGTKYRHVSVSLPYVIVLACFIHGEQGKLTLSQSNEA